MDCTPHPCLVVLDYRWAWCRWYGAEVMQRRVGGCNNWITSPLQPHQADQMHRTFDMARTDQKSPCRRSLPTPTDRLWGTKAVQPRLVPNGVPQSYPDSKIPILENPQLFEKLETEALFYAFYYQPGTYQQYLAARELKRQSWRYHKQHRAWFQVRNFDVKEGSCVQ